MEIVTGHLVEQDRRRIAKETGIDRKRVLRTSTWIRRAPIRDEPEFVSGNVEWMEHPSGAAGRT